MNNGLIELENSNLYNGVTTDGANYQVFMIKSANSASPGAAVVTSPKQIGTCASYRSASGLIWNFALVARCDIIQ